MTLDLRTVRIMQAGFYAGKVATDLGDNAPALSMLGRMDDVSDHELNAFIATQRNRLLAAGKIIPGHDA
jgi:hypothetical protein